jgi:hypothetical protein
VPTKSIEFSWDEGESWEKIEISEEDLMVENIIIEPNSISQQFMVYGSYIGEKNATDKEVKISGDGRAFLTYIDFSSLHEPQCKGADNAGDSSSDYELWSPNDGRHGDQKCFLGQQVTYVRRKQSSKCYNGEDHEAIIKREPCVCTEMDDECDIGYHRSEAGGNTCREVGSDQTEDEKKQAELELQNEQVEEFGYYEVTQGYRKIPGNICYGGVDLNPYRYSGNFGLRIVSFKGLIMMAILGALLYYGWPIIEAIIVLSPIPDPSDLKRSAQNAWS